MRRALACLLLVPWSAVAAVCPPALPEPVTNNAVAALDLDGRRLLFSFLGLGAGKRQADLTRAAWEFDPARGAWQALPEVPGPARLAAVAAAVGERVFLFGGYTVAADGSEVSRPEVLAWDARARRWSTHAPMPLPVDDSVALVWRSRWVLLVSGWHDDANVSAVQVYDTVTDRWSRATDYPGTPVFGHAGGLVGDRFVIADGVRVAAVVDGRRRYAISDEVWSGELTGATPEHIRWTRLPAQPDGPRYRMAAAGDAAGDRVLFVGGTHNPYNYDGVGYDRVPSAPLATVTAWDLGTGHWHKLAPRRTATMDHRGLLALGGRWATLGGMLAGQRVSPHCLAWP